MMFFLARDSVEKRDHQNYRGKKTRQSGAKFDGSSAPKRGSKKPFSGLFRRLAAVQIVAARSITSSNRTLVTSRMRSIFSVASLTDRLRYRERVRNQSAADNRR
jgi:hypothetical protein